MTRSARYLLAAGLALGGGVVALAPSAQAAACSTTSGVTVIVSSPAGTSTRCAPGDPSSGYTALTGAGFSITQMSQQPGFVCRIDGYPTADIDGCTRAGPQSKWTYYHAQRGGSWQYSSDGVGSYNPAPGSVEGWGWGGPPAVAPPPAITTPKPKPSTSSSSSKPAPKPSSSTRSTTRPPSMTPAGAASAASKVTTSTTSTTASTTTTSDPTTLGSSPVSTTDGVVAGGPIVPTSGSTSSGSAWPFIGGAAVVTALGGLAAYGARRRSFGQH